MLIITVACQHAPTASNSTSYHSLCADRSFKLQYNYRQKIACEIKLCICFGFYLAPSMSARAPQDFTHDNDLMRILVTVDFDIVTSSHINLFGMVLLIQDSTKNKAIFARLCQD